MGPYLGDFFVGSTIRHMWDTADSNGASITRATNGTVSVYKDNGTTQSVAGVTDTEDFDSLTGIHALSIDTSADATFYSAGSEFIVVLSAATIDGQTVNSVLGSFSLQRNFAAMGILDAGVAQAATASTIQFRAALALADDVIIGAVVYIRSATNGTGQAGIIADYDSATDTATMLANWTVTPTGTISYIIFAGAGAPDINAIKAVTDKLDTALEADGGVFRFTANALETAPTASDAGIASGTADSGTTTTMVDAALTQADTDYWRGNWIEFTSGSIAGQVRLITNFTPESDTITFSPATTQAVTTNTYKIHKGANAILAELTHTGAVIPTVTALTNMAAIFTQAMTEAYPANNAAMTPAEALYLITQFLTDFAIVGTTLTTRNQAGAAVATFTLNDGTSPTALSRTT